MQSIVSWIVLAALRGSCSSVQPVAARQEFLPSVARSSVSREARNLDFYVKSLDFQMLTFVPALKLSRDLIKPLPTNLPALHISRGPL